MAETAHAYENFVAQDFEALPDGKSLALHIGGLYTILVGRDPIHPNLFGVTLVNNLNGAIMPVIAPAEDVKIHINKAIEAATAQVAELYEAVADRHPNLE